MNIKIREAVLEDYEALCEIYKELDSYHRTNHPELFIKPEEEVRTKEHIGATIHDDCRLLLIAEINSQVVGLAECYIMKSSNFPLNKKREWVQLDNIAVKKEYQNSHIGSLLLDKISQWAKDRGISRVELKVYSFNQDAIQFYSKRKFKDLNRTMYLDL